MHSLRWCAISIASLFFSINILAAQVAADVSARQQQRLDSLVAVIQALQLRIAALESARLAGDTTVVDELAALRAAAAAVTSTPGTAASAQQTTRLGQNALNPEISVTGVFGANLRDPGPQEETFVPREFEIAFQSALDPFATAKVYVAFEDGEVEIEEGYLYFTALPGHLRLDAGRFRQTVGDINRWHLHALASDDYPLVLRRFAGEEGLISTGASLYWPLPLSGGAGTYELTVQGTAGGNDVLQEGGTRPAVNAQLSGFWQLSRSTFAQLTVSGMFASNPDTSLTTSLWVAGARFSWRPPQQAQAREFTLRGELWSLKREFALEGNDYFNDTRLGAYTDASLKLSRRWIANLRGDYVQTPEPGPAGREWAVTPSLTFWQSEFVYVRGLYEHFRDAGNSRSNRLSLQLVFAMGPHKHELF